MSKRAADGAPETAEEVNKKPFVAETTNGHEEHTIAGDAKAADANAESAATTKATLYHSTYCCSTRPLVVIQELGIADKIDVKSMEMPDLKKDDYLAVNPHGTVPTLKTACGSVLIESGAIALHLVEKYGGSNHALLGTPEQRPQLLQWLWYAPSTLYPLMVRGFESNEEAKAKAKTRLQTVNLPFIRDQLGSKNFLLGDNYTLADVYMGYELWGLDHLKWMDDFPTLQAYVKRLMERPSWAATSPAAPEKAE